VAVAAPLLVGLGFQPVLATAAALLGHAWSVTFGSLGSSYGALLRMTQLDPDGIALWASLFLALACLVTGAALCLMYGGRKGLISGLPAALVMGVAMGGSLMIVANFVLPYVASVVAGLVGLLVGGFVLPRLPWYRDAAGPESEESAGTIGFHTAFLPYYILLALVFGVYLSPLKPLLGQFEVGLAFPQTATALGFVNEATASYSSISLLTTPGTLILLAVLLSIAIFTYRGLWKASYNAEVVSALRQQAVPATVTVMTMSMMAVVMMESGMTTTLAAGTAEVAQSLYPVVAPFVGVLGAFMTGSNTSSNILFGAFQREVAAVLGVSTWIVASLQTAGGAIGNAISPMNVALGTGVTKIVGKEGEIIRKALGYTLLMALLVGAVGFAAIAVLGPAVP
jgi:lactate permease